MSVVDQARAALAAKLSALEGYAVKAEAAAAGHREAAAVADQQATELRALISQWRSVASMDDASLAAMISTVQQVLSPFVSIAGQSGGICTAVVPVDQASIRGTSKVVVTA